MKVDVANRMFDMVLIRISWKEELWMKKWEWLDLSYIEKGKRTAALAGELMSDAQPQVSMQETESLKE